MTATVDAPAGAAAGVATLGSPGGRLLAGPVGTEALDAHLARLGPLPDWWSAPADLRAHIEASGLTGRGGGHFPLAAKIAAARRSGAPAVVVANGSEGEPASAKDRLLMTLRPHLVLDGAEALAVAVGAERITVVTHAGATASTMAGAVAERPGPGIPTGVVVTPARYVAGESTAVVSFLNGRGALPAGPLVRSAVAGVDGRPTVVSNVETLAHLGLLARRGADWFRGAGTSGAPGSLLATVAGDVGRPGTVIELTRAVTVDAAVRAAGGPVGDPAAVLLGGYAGTWIPWADAAGTLLDPSGLKVAGTPFGCGVIAVVGDDRCGVAETAALVRWLAGESAGQCGPCRLGLPELAERVEDLADGARTGRRAQRRLWDLAATVTDRGLCRLPDDTVAMLASAATVFDAEIALHRRGRCSRRRSGSALGVPGPGSSR